MNKTFYEVLKTDGYDDYSVGYYTKKENAEKRAKRVIAQMDEDEREFYTVHIIERKFRDVKDEKRT